MQPERWWRSKKAGKIAARMVTLEIGTSEMRFMNMLWRVLRLEGATRQDWIATIDEDGNPAWLSGSGLRIMWDLMKLRGDLGKDLLSPEDLPENLREQVSLWSRADAGSRHGQIGQVWELVVDVCDEIMSRG